MGDIWPSSAPSSYYDLFIWQNGTSTDLGTAGWDVGLAHGINSSGSIEGELSGQGGRAAGPHAALWSPGTLGPQDLNGLIPAGSGSMLRVEHGNGSKARTVPLCPEAKAYLKAWLEIRPEVKQTGFS